MKTTHMYTNRRMDIVLCLFSLSFLCVCFYEGCSCSSFFQVKLLQVEAGTQTALVRND